LQTILLVEDDPVLGLAQAALVSRMGYRCLHVETGLEAIGVCASASPAIDLVLMDLDLGEGMDGTEAARRILAQRDLPLIFLSSITDPETIAGTEQITSYGYVAKSSHPTAVSASIKMAFRLHAARTALESSDRRFQALFEHSAEGIVVLDFGCTLLRVNKTLCDLLLCSSEDLLGKTVVQIKAFSAAAFERHLDELVHNDRLLVEGAFERKDGVALALEVNARLFEYEGKARVLATVRDVSGRRNAERAFEQSQHRYGMIFENSVSNNAIYDDHCRLVVHNRKFLEILESAAPAAVGKTVEELFVPAEARLFRERIELALSSGTSNTYTTPFASPQGQKWYQSSYHPIVDDPDHFRGVLVVSQDITGAFRLDEILKKNDKLEAIGLLAGGVAHDFNNLLSGLSGYLDLMRLKFDQEPEQTTLTRLGKASQVVRRGKSLTRQLLSFAKANVPDRKLHHLGPLLKDWAEFSLSGSDLSLVLELAPDLWPCDCDGSLVSQAVDNLLINARQVSPPGGEICLKAENITGEPQFVCIRVTDQGPGIDPDVLGRIFDPFFTTKASGSGLGLASTRSIAEQHLGRIEVDSRPGFGATFSLYLPASHADGPVAAPEAAGEFRASGWAVLMDDDQALRETLAEILESFGYQVMAARNGHDALAFYSEACREEKPVVLALLDLTIPGGMGGLEVSRALRGLGYRGSIVSMSGYSELSAEAWALAEPLQGHLPKPFSREELARFLATGLKPVVA